MKKQMRNKIITLDLPPTTNHSYASASGHWYKTRLARDWDEKTLWSLKKIMLKPVLGFVRVEIVFYLKRDRDIDGSIKPILDILAKGKAYKNDKQIVELRVIKAVDKKSPRCEVFFEEIYNMKKVGTLTIQKNQSHQSVMLPTQLAKRIVKIANYMKVTPDEWIIDRLYGQLSRFKHQSIM